MARGCRWPTGAASGIWVLDIDVKPDANGAAELAKLEQIHGRLPKTLIVSTPSGGTHYYFQHTEGIGNRGRVEPGIDVRGQGGYVIWWFAAGHECLDHTAPAPWPAWLSRVFWPPKPVLHRYTHRAPVTLTDRDLQRIKATAIDRVRSAADGQRHYRLRASARLLGGVQHSAGFSDTDAIE